MGLILKKENSIEVGKNSINRLLEKSVVEKKYFNKFFIEPNQKTTRYSMRRVAGTPISTVSRGKMKDTYFYNEVVGASFVSSHDSLATPSSLKKKKIYLDYFIRDQDFWREPGSNNTGSHYLKRKRKKTLLKKSDTLFFKAQCVPILNIAKKKLYSYSPSQVEMFSFYNSESALKKKVHQEKRRWKGQRFKMRRKYNKWACAFFKRGVVDKHAARQIKTAYQIRLFTGRGKAKRLFGKAFRRTLLGVAAQNLI